MAEEKTKEEQDLQNRLYQSIGFEVAANTAVDAATGWFMPAAPVYAGVNFIAGGAINTLAQLWRQDDNFSWGEVGASSAIGIVPGLGGKGVTGIARATAKGAGLGVAHEAIRVGVDEQRLLTPEEVAGGALIGGTFGGGTKVVGDVVGDSVGVLAKHQTDKIANRKAKGFYNRPGDPYVDRTDIWKPDDLTGPQKTYTKGMEKRPYPPEYGRANWDWYSQSGVSAADQLKNRGMKRSVPEEILEAADLRMKLENSIDGTFEPTHWTKLKSRTLDNLLKESGKGKGNIRYVQNLIRQLDEYRLKNPDLDMPIQGFTKDLGRRPTFIGPKGEEFGIGWSRKKFKKTGVGYEVYNVQQRLQSRAKRIAQSKASNPHNASEAAVLFALKRHINRTSRIWDPTQRKYITKPVGEWDIMIQNPGSAYVEHLVSVDSPYWRSTRGIKSGIKAGDPDNLTIIGDHNFKTLKDSVEKHIHTNYDNLYVDYNRSSQNLVVRDLKTGTSYKTEIPGYGNAKDFRTYIEDTLQNKPMKTLEEVNPDMPPNVKRQIKGTEKEGWYFKD